MDAERLNYAFSKVQFHAHVGWFGRLLCRIGLHNTVIVPLFRYALVNTIEVCRRCRKWQAAEGW